MSRIITRGLLQRTFQLITLAAATLPLVFLLYTGLSAVWEGESSSVRPAFSRLNEFKLEMARLDVRVQELQEQLKAVVEAGPPNNPSAKLAEIGATVEAVDNRLKALEAAIVESPSKALTIPLLRKDLDALRESQTQAVAGANDAIGRVYDLNKWFIGLMLTIAVSVLGLAISNILQARKKTE